jgi:hypothetical protein
MLFFRGRQVPARDYPGLLGIARASPGVLGITRDYPETLFSPGLSDPPVTGDFQMMKTSPCQPWKGRGLGLRGPKCENRALVNVLAPFSRFPGSPKSKPNGFQMDSKIINKCEQIRKLGVRNGGLEEGRKKGRKTRLRLIPTTPD